MNFTSFYGLRDAFIIVLVVMTYRSIELVEFMDHLGSNFFDSYYLVMKS